MKLRDGTPEQAGVSASQVRKIVERAHGWVDDGIHPSLVVIAARRGVVFLHEAFGRLGPEEGAPPLQKDTIFPLASISKPITATAAMILVEEGLLGLNRPVKDYVPEFEGEDKNQVLIRQLLTHTSGLSDSDLIKHANGEGIELDEESSIPWITKNVNAYLDLVCQMPLGNPPDTEMIYADLNYNLLGAVIHRVSGISLSDFAEQRIFQPLGMKDTSYIVSDTALDRVVQRSPDVPDYDLTSSLMKSSLGSAGAYSTVMDIALFGQMFLNHGRYGGTRILSRASIEAMTHNQIPGIGAQFLGDKLSEAEWGLGWSTHINKKTWRWDEALQSPTSYSHGGSGGVMLWVDPVYEFVAAYFAVYPGFRKNGWPITNADLFINAALATIVDL